MKIPFETAIKEWAAAAVLVLEDVAGTYGGYITYAGLTTWVFDETRIYTLMLLPNLSSRLLNRVIRICHERDLPALSSLVVNATDGMVGSGFDEVLWAAGREVPATDLDRERVAAAERLKCYRVYCTDVPADAEPHLTAKYQALVSPVEKDAPKPKPVCVVHGMQLPVTGVCDYCA
ncbi:hypothetical protein IV500_06475 [Paeniglutamicibacter antarcticus]|uniref:Uncharacterized protein n=1 Tax=Arthrobacter terrae TaxID=2935737 RepID=A0A931G515_9MICC|nr:hypothetical protein [Arthrobacter terrae]MBG0739045.1 hypothetical protein [Arthrobacter terrae]